MISYLKLLWNITLIYLVHISITGTVIANWGPFRSCGLNNPKNLDDCDKYSLTTGLGCCFITYFNQSENGCIFVGGKAQGFFNNKTSDEYNDLNNLDFPIMVANRTEEANNAYIQDIKQIYGSKSPKSIIRCKSNICKYISLYKFSLYIVIYLIFG